MAERGLPEEAGNRTKTTETESRSPLPTVYACTGRFPPKYELQRMPTNQIITFPVRVLSRSRVAGRLGGYIKRVQLRSTHSG